MEKGTVQAGGHVTLPESVRDQAAIAPGDVIVFKVIGPRKVLLEVLPVAPLRFFWDKFGGADSLDDAAVRKEWHDIASAETIDE